MYHCLFHTTIAQVENIKCVCLKLGVFVCVLAKKVFIVLYYDHSCLVAWIIVAMVFRFVKVIFPEWFVFQLSGSVSSEVYVSVVACFKTRRGRPSTVFITLTVLLHHIALLYTHTAPGNQHSI